MLVKKNCSECYLVSKIPRMRLVRKLRFRKNKDLYILDTSLIDFIDRRPEIQKFIMQMKSDGFSGNIDVIKPLDFEDQRWQANTDGVKSAIKKFSRMVNNDLEGRFLGNYLAHRTMEKECLNHYIEKIVEGFADKGIFLNTSGVLDSSSILYKRIGSMFVVLLGFPALLILLARYTVKNIHISSSVKKKTHGGVCVDLTYCNIYKTDQYVDTGGGSDAFLVQEKGMFSLANHVFIALGWIYPPDKIKLLNKKLHLSGSCVVGDRAGTVNLHWMDLLRCVFNNLRLWMLTSLLCRGSDDGWSWETRWLHIKYQLDRFRAQVAFNDFTPSVYLSRLDYSYIHHPIASVCREKKIHHVGICHSPGAGMAHVPQTSIISFDEFLVYTDDHPRIFYPTWKNDFTKLYSVGTWRADYIHYAKKEPGYIKDAKNVKDRFYSCYLIALHLPVPDSYLYQREDVERWMGYFYNILMGNPSIAFVLLPRRLESSPGYFIKLIEKLTNTGRAEIGSYLNPQWKTSYPWTTVCDLIVGCAFSDAVLEALAYGKPALSYSDVGSGKAEFEKIDTYLSVYDEDSLSNVILAAREGKWPSKELWERIQNELVGVSDGKCIDRIRSRLSTKMKPVKLASVNI